MGGVSRHRKNLGVLVLELGALIADRAELAGADAGEREWIEEQHDVLLAAEVREFHFLLVLVPQGEVRSLVTDLNRHAVPPEARVVPGMAHSLALSVTDAPAGLQRRPQRGWCRREVVKACTDGPVAARRAAE